MKTLDHPTTLKMSSFRSIAGIILILAGAVLFLDRYLKTGWLSLLILPAVGGFFYVWGVRMRHSGLIIAGALLAGFGLGGIAAWGPAIRLMGSTVDMAIKPQSLLSQMGAVLLSTGLAWGVIVITTIALDLRRTWWALLPGGIMAALGYCLLFSSLQWVDFVLALALGTGIPLLLWGIVSRLLGLIIPGSLLSGAGPGIYLAWSAPQDGNTLVRTGIMLVAFAFGWCLISFFGRWIGKKNLWWPLIPGGILAVVGLGLYIGGDPSRALGFIGNTGSIALMIFGLYLLLMRKSIHH